MGLLSLTYCLLLLPLWGSVIVLCFVVHLLYVHSSYAIIFMGKRELVALLSLSSWCLRFVIVVFPTFFAKEHGRSTLSSLLKYQNRVTSLRLHDNMHDKIKSCNGLKQPWHVPSLNIFIKRCVH